TRSRYRFAAPLTVKLMPFRPVRVPTLPLKPIPVMLRFRNRTVRVGSFALTAILIVMPLTPLDVVAPKPAPSPPSKVIDFVIVTVPYDPGSSASISPLIAVFEIAPAQVLHGAVRLQGFTSSPTPDTQVLMA